MITKVSKISLTADLKISPEYIPARILFFDESLTAQFFPSTSTFCWAEEKSAACVQRARPYFSFHEKMCR